MVNFKSLLYSVLFWINGRKTLKIHIEVFILLRPFWICQQNETRILTLAYIMAHLHI